MLKQTDPDPDPTTAPPGPFIAVSQGAILDRLAETWRGQGTSPTPTPIPTPAPTLAQVARLLGLLFRIEGWGVLVALRDDYHPFNPDLPAEAARDVADRDAAYARLRSRLDTLLLQANFDRVDPDCLNRAEREAAEVDARVRVPRAQYADVGFFARGRRSETTTRRRLFGLVRETRRSVRLRHVVVVIRYQEATEPPPRGRLATLWGAVGRRLARALDPGYGGRSLRPAAGMVVIKLFSDVAEADLNMLYPGARAVMRVRDKLLLGVPAVAGGVPVLMNILPALSVLGVVAAAWLGLTAEGSVPQQEMAKALAAMSALAGLGGFLMRQWVKFERQVLKYQMVLTDTLVFRNVCNNAAVFDFLLGTAEDQEFKEALLAYCVLERTDRPLDAAGLKAAVESWLADTFGVPVDFDIDGAVEKLARLEVLDSDPGAPALRVLPAGQALARLRARWVAEAGGADDRHPAGADPAGADPARAL